MTQLGSNEYEEKGGKERTAVCRRAFNEHVATLNEDGLRAMITRLADNVSAFVLNTVAGLPEPPTEPDESPLMGLEKDSLMRGARQERERCQTSGSRS